MNLWFMQENGLIRKLRLILKFLTSSAGKQVIANMHVAEYLKKQRQSGNEDWLVYKKCGGETSLGSFSKKSKLSVYLDQQSEILYSLFYCMSMLRVSKINCR